MEIFIFVYVLDFSICTNRQIRTSSSGSSAGQSSSSVAKPQWNSTYLSICLQSHASVNSARTRLITDMPSMDEHRHLFGFCLPQTSHNSFEPLMISRSCHKGKGRYVPTVRKGRKIHMEKDLKTFS